VRSPKKVKKGPVWNQTGGAPLLSVRFALALVLNQLAARARTALAQPPPPPRQLWRGQASAGSWRRRHVSSRCFVCSPWEAVALATRAHATADTLLGLRWSRGKADGAAEIGGNTRRGRRGVGVWRSIQSW